MKYEIVSDFTEIETLDKLNLIREAIRDSLKYIKESIKIYDFSEMKVSLTESTTPKHGELFIGFTIPLEIGYVSTGYSLYTHCESSIRELFHKKIADYLGNVFVLFEDRMGYTVCGHRSEYYEDYQENGPIKSIHIDEQNAKWVYSKILKDIDNNREFKLFNTYKIHKLLGFSIDSLRISINDPKFEFRKGVVLNYDLLQNKYYGGIIASLLYQHGFTESMFSEKLSSLNYFYNGSIFPIENKFKIIPKEFIDWVDHYNKKDCQFAKTGDISSFDEWYSLMKLLYEILERYDI